MSSRVPKWLSLSNGLILLLAAVISFFMMVLLIAPPKKAYHHSTAYRAVNALDVQLQKADIDFEKSLEPNERTQRFNEWLCDQLDKKSELAKQLGDSPDADPWGNFYQYSRRSKEAEKSQTGVYSLGRDKLSKSMGNDRDDINSWDKNSGAIYAQAVFAAGMKQILWPTLIMAPLMFVVLRRMLRHLEIIKR
jgi:hypothetical protein